MVKMFWTGLSVVLLVVSLWAAPGASIPVTTPMMDHFIAINSDENVTYSCTVTDSGSVVVWEVERSQIRNPTQFQQLADLGIIIEPADTLATTSTITITRNARESNDDAVIMVQCLANQGISSIEGERYSVTSFFAPSAVIGLDLLPSLNLVWSRPSVPPFPQVPINYTIEINATEGGGMNFRNFTSDTSFSVQFLEDMLRELGSECVEFEFFVTPTNDAGTGPLQMIPDTVPISPDVTTISDNFRVERVDLQSLRVDLSFPAVQPCSQNFLLDNYTIFLDGGVALVIDSPDQVVTGVPLTGLTLAGLSLDDSFSVTVQACNEVTCRTSNASALNTTDVQTIQAVFFQNRLFLQCSFADNSQAQGCVFTLVLIGSTNETERFEVRRRGNTGSLCTTANNQREVYSSVLAMDWEENGEDGSVTLNVTNSVMNVSTLAEYTSLTGCVDATNPTAAIVGGIFGALTGALIIAVVVVLLVLFFVGRKKNKVVERPMFSTLERKKRFAALTPAEEQPLMFECDVTADKECASKIKDDLIAAQRQASITSDSTPEASATSKTEFSMISMADVEKDKHAWIEDHDDPDPEKPLTIKVKWRPLIQSLIAVNSLRPDAKPLLAEGKDLSKVKVRLDMS